ncbi:glycosyltransferase [Agrococcus terreus]|uniref:4,4'-diaponeurosporenoate glycosyltransferase n=1 Tax=Agrococcus terreus TaxID=574649 RepID=A0ABQ2KPB0_9MICO|nr:glycosyltransferase [Agrococcus terreus]GGN89091.1 hypothetical protein GCM10010968_25380 [Agrococcus terreus]
MTSRIGRILVVVPARDEEATIGACVESIRAARAALRAERRDVLVRVVVVADACTDATARIAGAAGAEVVEIAAAAVGAARQAGVDHGTDPRDAATTWIATTDGDSAVPVTWLLDHLAAAEDDAALVVGAVEPDPAHLAPPVLAAWHAQHDHLAPGSSVHGANLGVRADALARAGGFAPLQLHEDVDLVARLRASGARVDAVPRPRVRTSGRLRGRTAGGFAGYLAALADRQAG